MENRNEFISNTKQRYVQHRNPIQNTIIMGIMVILFTSGCVVSAMFLHKPCNKSRLDYYKEIAIEVFNQGDTPFIEVPDGILVNKKTSSNVTISSKRYTGRVIAKLEDGLLTFTEVSGIAETIFYSILMGMIFLLVPILICSTIFSFFEKKKN